MTSTGNRYKIPWQLMLIFLLLSAGILFLGYVYYENQAAHFRREIEAQLNAIADLKVKQIAAWRQERMHDAVLIFDDPIFASEVQEWLEKKALPGQKVEILHRMQGLKQTMYEGIRLLDSLGTVRLAIPEDQVEVGPVLKELIREAISGHKVVFSDLHHDPENNIRIDLVVPMYSHKKGQEILVGNIIMKVNPYQSLFPLVESWPTPSLTGELTLARREGNEIVFLNNLRHRQDTALALRRPLTQESLPIVQAALGKEVIMEGTDYHGVPVLAATRIVPDSPWFLVAKLDLSEVSAPLKERFHLVAILLLALIASSGAGVAYSWRSRDALFYRQRYEAERQRLDLARRYEYLTQHANDIIFILDKDLKIIEANERAFSAYGYARQELFTLHLLDLFPREVLDNQNSIMGKLNQRGQTLETEHRRKDGTTFPVAIGSTEIDSDTGKIYQLIIRDVTKSRDREKILEESERRLRDLSSQLLVVQEKERRRISKELHDELGQGLMMVKYGFSTIRGRLRRDQEQLKRDSDDMLGHLDILIENIRRLSRDLSPLALEELGLSSALKYLADEFHKHSKIQIFVTIEEVDDLISKEGQINIYRIFQECLTNIWRHSQATQVSVVIKKEGDLVSFTLEDDGKGFDPAAALRQPPQKKGLGLAAMNERIRMVGGTLEISSREGSGTKIRFKVPFNRKEKRNEVL